MAAPCDVELTEPDRESAAAVTERASHVLRPAGALARLDAVAAWLAGWQRTATPSVRRARCIIFAGDHGVARNGISAYPASVTAEMTRAFEAGVATANALARVADVHLRCVDVAVGRPTADLTTEPAMNAEEFARAWRLGVDAVAEMDCDLLALGEMGIGNTAASAAVAASLFGGDGRGWVGRGTGVDDVGLERKCAAVALAQERAAGLPPLDILRVVGGAELVAIAAAVVEARRRSIPVLLDGYVVAAAVAPLEAAHPGLLEHCLAAHRSPEPGHSRLLALWRKEPLLDLGLRLGEGSGALLAVPLVRMAAAAVVDVATFAEWGLDG